MQFICWSGLSWNGMLLHFAVCPNHILSLFHAVCEICSRAWWIRWGKCQLALRKTTCSSGWQHKCCCGLRRERQFASMEWRNALSSTGVQALDCFFGLVLKWLKMKLWGKTYLLQLHARFCAKLKWDVVTLIWKVSKTEINLSKVKGSDSQGLLVLGK